jgi:hypothetical protein
VWPIFPIQGSIPSVKSESIRFISFPFIPKCLKKAEKLSRDRLIDIFRTGLALLIWSFLPNVIVSFITQMIAEKLLTFQLNLPYSRLIESEADKVGEF